MKRRYARKTLWIIAAIGLIGIGLSAESYREFYRVVKGEGTWCHFGEVSNCEKAFESSYSVLFGRPISIYGAVTYFLIAATALLGLLNGGPYVLASILHLGLMSVVLVGATGYFAWALFAQVKTFCILCVMDYLVNLSVIALSWRACWKLHLPFGAILRWDARSMLGSAKDFARTLLMLALIATLGALIIRTERWYYIHSRHFDLVIEGDVERMETPWAKSFPSQGPEGAPIQVIVFADYECPFCAIMKGIWSRIMDEYPELVRLSAISFPMNSDCNPYSASNTLHPHSCEAARFALTVFQKRGPDAFWEVQIPLYLSAKNLDRKSLVAIGASVGLTEEDVDASLAKSNSIEGFEFHYRAAGLIEMEGLPMTLLNGIVIGGYVEDWALRKILQAELKRKNLRMEDFRKK
jgi:uncharacterized membrane protein/predicted DsbA family dithiol-disulfide isomerase